MKSKEMTPTEYAKERGINKSHVQRYCKSNKALPGVREVKKFGRTYVLVMKKDYQNEL